MDPAATAQEAPDVVPKRLGLMLGEPALGCQQRVELIQGDVAHGSTLPVGIVSAVLTFLVSGALAAM